MARPKGTDVKKINAELLFHTYGALVLQMIDDYDDVNEVNKQLYKMGNNIGVRLIEDFIVRNNIGRCKDFTEVSETIAKTAFPMYLGVPASVSNWNATGDEFSLLLDQNPIIEFVTIPDRFKNLNYLNILCGVIVGALESLQIECQAWFVKDTLKGDSVSEIRVKYVRRLEDAIPVGDD